MSCRRPLNIVCSYCWTPDSMMQAGSVVIHEHKFVDPLPF